MQIEVLKSKIHRVTITEANLNYVGSITIDEELMEAANLIEGERVQIWNVTNGERLDTYVIRGRRGSGAICLNGAAARKAQVGDVLSLLKPGATAADGVTVTIKQPEKLTDFAAYSLTGEGNVSGLTISVEDGSLTFTTDGSPYYVLGEKVSGETSSPSEPSNSPQTGDNSHMALWMVLLAVSVFGLAGTSVYSKRKRVS